MRFGDKQTNGGSFFKTKGKRGGEVGAYKKDKHGNVLFNTKYRSASWVRKIDPISGEVIEKIPPKDHYETKSGKRYRGNLKGLRDAHPFGQ